jgi:hypothetical protein
MNKHKCSYVNLCFFSIKHIVKDPLYENKHLEQHQEIIIIIIIIIHHSLLLRKSFKKF